jgi:hypothetical protein
MRLKKKHYDLRKRCCLGVKGCMGKTEERMHLRKGHTLGKKWIKERMNMGK